MDKQSGWVRYFSERCEASGSAGESFSGTSFFYTKGHDFEHVGLYGLVRPGDGSAIVPNVRFLDTVEYQKCCHCGLMRCKSILLKSKWEMVNPQDFIADIITGKLTETTVRRRKSSFFGR